MLELVTAEQMREKERETFALGLAPIVVMEDAAAGVTEWIARRFDVTAKIVAVCGKGNNGGDGFAVARLLFLRGYRVTILKVFPETSTAGAKTNFEIASRLGIPVTEDETCLRDCDVIVDAVLGIGIKGEVDLTVVDSINAANAYVISVDIPTGICSDRGIVCKKAVRADATVTFGCKKTGLALHPGAAYAGEVSICNASIQSSGSSGCYEPQKSDLAAIMPQLPSDANKSTRGRVLVFAGAPGMTGAAAMVCRSALRCGSGLVTLGVPKNLNAIMEVKLTEAMTLPLDCEGQITLQAVKNVFEKISEADCVVVGPGLGKNPEVLPIIQLLAENNLPLIVDADGINALAANIDSIKEHSAPVILTPHPGEFARLCGRTIPEVQENRLKMAREFAVRHNVVLVLKGAGTVTAVPDGRCFINPTGNPGMAVGGSGDVLAGMIASLLGRGMKADQAAMAGVYVHGLTGDLLKEKMGEDGMLPTDLIGQIPYALQRIKNPER